ncbi:hypothetical protein KIPB_017054, partial [Kipferlia bialata]
PSLPLLCVTRRAQTMRG